MVFRVQALQKTVLGQITVFPVYVATFFAYSGLLEGKSLGQAIAKTKEKFVPTFVAGSVFWPIANVINFQFVPASQRVLYVGAVGLMWNTFLSWQNSLKTSKQK